MVRSHRLFAGPWTDICDFESKLDGFTSVNLSSFLMHVAASFTAWTLANKNEELANSYAVVAQELARIGGRTSADN